MMEAVPADRAGLAAGVLNSGRQVAGGLGVAAFGAPDRGPRDFVTGMRVSLLIAAGLLTVSGVATLGLRKGR